LTFFKFHETVEMFFRVINRTILFARVVPRKIQNEIPENHKFDIQDDMNKFYLKFIVRSNKNRYIDN